MMKYPKFNPSALFLMTITLSITVSFMKPWYLTHYLDIEVMRFIGIVLLCISFIFNLLAYKMFKKHNTPHAPFSTPVILIKSGIFTFTRNPVYLALVLSQCGLAFIFDTVWVLFGALILLITLQYFIIPDEEKVMQAKFKDSYKEYRKHTRRWF